MESNFLMAIFLTTLAGLSTTIGSAIALFYRKPGPIYMSFALGFSAGVMLLVSFVELLGQAIKSIGFGTAHIAFFLGFIIMFLIDTLVSHKYIAEDYHTPHEKHSGHMLKTSVLVAIGIGIHNFPEGMATFAATMSNINVGIAMAVAIAIHNIPEGIAVAVPVYAATKSSKKAFWWSFLSGVSEPIGALIAGLILLPFLNDIVLGWTLAIVGGFMVYISLDELLPVSRAYGKEHVSIMGVLAGMAVMALSLALL